MAITLVASVAMGGSAGADDTTRAAAEAAARQMMEDAYVYLGVAYLCQKALGTSHYHAALIAVEGSAIMGGKSHDDAVILADEFATKIKSDFPKLASASNTARCMERLLPAQDALRLSQARFRKAAQADQKSGE